MGLGFRLRGNVIMGINGDYMSLAEACGEATHSRGWVSGIDFDPYDSDEMEIMELVWENERHDRMAELERENDFLRRRISELEDCE